MTLVAWSEVGALVGVTIIVPGFWRMAERRGHGCGGHFVGFSGRRRFLLHWFPLATVLSRWGALVLLVYARPPRLWRRGDLARCLVCRLWWLPGAALYVLLHSWIWWCL